MKLNGTILMICAAAAVLSCAKSIEPETVPSGEGIAIDGTAPTISAALEAPSKTVLKIDGAKGYVYWTETSDLVSINGSKYAVSKVDASSRTSADLSLVEGERDVAEDEAYTAYYPAGIYNGGVTILPAEQKFKAVDGGETDPGVTGDISEIMPMYGEGSNKSVQFKNILGLLEITLKADAAVKKIEVSDANLGMCGAFGIPGAEEGNYSAVLNNAASKLGVTLNCGEGVAISGGVKFYVAVPAGTYRKLDIKVYDTTGKVCDLPAFGTARVERNKIYPLSFEPVFGDEIKFIDLGLPSGLLWANMNLGAKDVYDPGYYFFWGDPQGYVHNGSKWVEAGGTAEIQFNNTTYGSSVGFPVYSGSATWSATVNDAAAVALGGNCHIPSTVDFSELFTNMYTVGLAADKCVYVFAPDAEHPKGRHSDQLGVLNKEDALLVLPFSNMAQGNAYGGSPYYSFLLAGPTPHYVYRGCDGADTKSYSEALGKGAPVRAVKPADNICTIIAKPATGCEDMGTVSGSDLYPSGATATLTATPKEGYWFVQWSDGVTTATRTVTVTTDATYEAVFAMPEFVDLGLPSGTLWATKNVGASAETDCGDYFAYGELETYYYSLTPLIWREGKAKGYACTTYCNGSSTYVEWETPPYDNITNELKPEFDICTQTLGEECHVPTKEQWQELIDECKWTSQSNSMKVSKKGDNSVFIILPLAGRYQDTGFVPNDNNGVKMGNYWSSTCRTVQYGYTIFFNKNLTTKTLAQNSYRAFGCSIRPVKEASVE